MQKPQVHLLTLWGYDYPIYDEHVICCGLWVVSSVEIKNEKRLYTLTCCNPHTKEVNIGDTRIMEEELILVLCTEFKIVKLPKREFVQK